MKNLLVFLLLSAFVSACSQSKSKYITELSREDVETGVLLDVRTPREYNSGHIDEAINIDWLGKGFIEKAQALDKDKPVFVYCKKGGRSAEAARVLDSLGFKKVVDLKGGYDAYKAEAK
ncbi:rhodanese-like domain-containing protein [Pseudozobellia thermophila]|uniref:Rhodanese-related sulfurtransferase n=1 Tax=Pseudozobellia thermophila TaxID=192903 RepID=A0A1M6LT11_9FLAO|nr:rhodanese-like domain-containing protein [Pseudozobellia thermophila]SHJ74232.1 Rhodanese-related sulfurtransferase [Pseudozobellia thermophila]